MTRPHISNEQPPADNPLAEWLRRLALKAKQSVRYLYNWIDEHVYLEDPWEQDPHGQYWHKVLDPAWANLFFEDFASPKTIANGGVVTNWSDETVTDYHIVSDLVAGTITINGEPNWGTYYMGVSGYGLGAKNTTYVLTLHQNGVATKIRMPLVFGPNTEEGALVYTGIVHVAEDSTLDLRLEVGTSLQIPTITWSMFRFNPVSGANPNASGDIATIQSIPPDWPPRPGV